MEDMVRMTQFGLKRLSLNCPLFSALRLITIAAKPSKPHSLRKTTLSTAQ